MGGVCNGGHPLCGCEVCLSLPPSLQVHLHRVPGHILQPHCYSDGHSELLGANIDLTINKTVSGQPKSKSYRYHQVEVYR